MYRGVLAVGQDAQSVGASCSAHQPAEVIIVGVGRRLIQHAFHDAHDDPVALLVVDLECDGVAQPDVLFGVHEIGVDHQRVLVLRQQPAAGHHLRVHHLAAGWRGVDADLVAFTAGHAGLCTYLRVGLSVAAGQAGQTIIGRRICRCVGALATSARASPAFRGYHTGCLQRRFLQRLGPNVAVDADDNVEIVVAHRVVHRLIERCPHRQHGNENRPAQRQGNHSQRQATLASKRIAQRDHQRPAEPGEHALAVDQQPVEGTLTKPSFAQPVAADRLADGDPRAVADRQQRRDHWDEQANQHLQAHGWHGNTFVHHVEVQEGRQKAGESIGPGQARRDCDQQRQQAKDQHHAEIKGHELAETRPDGFHDADLADLLCHDGGNSIDDQECTEEEGQQSKHAKQQEHRRQYLVSGMLARLRYIGEGDDAATAFHLVLHQIGD